jgi:UDP-N-acetylmuramate dehydrogenase
MNIYANYDLKNQNTFHFSVKARFFIEVRHASAIPTLRQDPLISSLPWQVIGNGSNIILSHDLDCVILKCIYDEIKLVKEDNESVWLSVGAGCNWHDFVTYTVDKGWWGLENLALIPGTVGAAPVHNIGAYGTEVQDTITRIQSFDLRDGARIELRRNECNFTYRSSVFTQSLANRALIHRVTFRLRKQATPNLMNETLHNLLLAKYESIEAITPRQVYEEVIAIRNQRIPDPNLLGSAGSFFKNPCISSTHYQTLQTHFPDIPGHKTPDGLIKIPAAWLIEQVNWKGKRIGNAGVYEKHALILVNYGNATGKDILALAENIREDVISKFSIALEKEVVVI